MKALSSKSRFLAFGILSFAPACGAILDLPDPTVDPDFGLNDGSTNPNDSQIPGDSEPAADGKAQTDGSKPNDDGGKNDGGIVSPDGGPHTPCGALDCLGGACVDDTYCQAYSVFSQAGLSPSAIDSDGTDVFFVSQQAGIDRYNASSGTVDVLVDSEDGIQNIAVFGSSFYFTRTASGAGGVWSCPTAGVAHACGSGTSRATYVSGSNSTFFGVAADATALYFAYDQSTSPYGIYHCGVGGLPCSPMAVASTKMAHQVRDVGGNIFWNDNTVSENGVYQYTGSLSHGSDSLNVVDLAADASNVYFTTMTTVSSRTLSGTALKTIIASRTSNVAVGVDSSYVYWLDSVSGGTEGVLQRCAIADDCTANAGKIQTLATSLHDAQDFVVTDDSVYISTLQDIYRVVK